MSNSCGLCRPGWSCGAHREANLGYGSAPDAAERDARQDAETAIWDEMNDNLSDMLTRLPSVPIRPSHEDYDEGDWNRRLTKESARKFDRAFESYVKKLEAIGVADARKRATEKWYR